jgi:hypothetical protein
VTVPCSGVWATYAHENELVNPDFDLGEQGWEDHSSSVLFGSKAEHDTTAWDPAGQGEVGYMRQVVDDSQFPGWNPLLNHKIGQLSFYLYSTGDAWLQVGFDWWDRLTGPKPLPGDIQGYHYVVLPQQYRSTAQWTLVTVPFDWAGRVGNNQPRWVSVEFYYYGCTGIDYAAVDSTEFWGECVPEPSSLIAVFGGMLSAGLVLRKRR